MALPDFNKALTTAKELAKQPKAQLLATLITLLLLALGLTSCQARGSIDLDGDGKSLDFDVRDDRGVFRRGNRTFEWQF
jgi:hypothetical protein